MVHAGVYEGPSIANIYLQLRYMCLAGSYIEREVGLYEQLLYTFNTSSGQQKTFLRPNSTIIHSKSIAHTWNICVVNFYGCASTNDSVGAVW